MDRASPPAGSSTVAAHRSVQAWVALGAVLLPFTVAALRLLAARTAGMTLPDDLALIEFHTRHALDWTQSLGPFDRNGWNHPGPSYFYLLTIPARLLGSGPRAIFLGATAINGAAAACTVWAVRRRAGDGAALVAATAIGLLAFQLSFAGPLDVTYSESPLGALVSPWNPTVVIFPLLLTLVLCAAGPSGSPLSLLGAALTGTFVVQTDIATAPLVAVVATAALVATVARAARGRRARAESGAASPRRAGRRQVAWWAVGGGLVVLAWIPPLVEQLTGHPGNLTRIARYFSAARQGQGFHDAAWGLVTVQGVLATGPTRVIGAILGAPPQHAALAAVATGLGVAAGAVGLVAGMRSGRAFSVSLAAAGLLGTAVTLVSALRIPGFLFGYLLLWSVVCPVVSVVALGTLGLPRAAQAAARSAARTAVAVAAAVLAVLVTVQVVRLPPLADASDPVVGQLTALVRPHLHIAEDVYVGDAGPDLIQLERFIGLVNQLDARGIRPTVSPAWRAQFGSAFVSHGHESASVLLTPWLPASTALPGYLGRAGRIAVQLLPGPPRP